MSDAKYVIECKPDWVKGWARMAAAYFGLHDYVKSKEIYKKAMELDAGNKILEDAYEKVKINTYDNILMKNIKAEVMSRKQLKEGKHIFHKEKLKDNNKKYSSSSNNNKGSKKVKLSFEDEDE